MGRMSVLLRPPQTFGDVSSLPCYSRPSVARVNIPGPPNRVFAILQQLGRSHDLFPDFDHYLVPFPTRLSAYAPAEPTARSARRATTRQGQLRERAIRQVTVLE